MRAPEQRRPAAATAGTPDAATSTKHPGRREQILRAAVELFHAKGYRQTTVEEIATRVGLTAGAIYHHFDDKRAILDAAVEVAAAAPLDRARRLAAQHTDPALLLAALIDDGLRCLFSDPALASVGRNDRLMASPEVVAAAARADRLLIAEWAHPLCALHPELSDTEAQVVVRAALGAAASLTHTRSSLGPRDLEGLLADALRRIVLPARARRRGGSAARTA